VRENTAEFMLQNLVDGELLSESEFPEL